MRRHPRSAFTAALAVVLVVSTTGCSGEDEPRPDGIAGAEPASGTVAAEADGSGADTTAVLVASSPIAVVATPDAGAQGRAASAAVALRVPMLTVTDAGADRVRAELDRMGARQILTVGDPRLDAGDRTVVVAPASREALEQTIGVRFHDQTAFPADRIDDVTAHQVPEQPALIDSGPVTGPDAASGERLAPRSAAWSGEAVPHVLVDDRTPVAAVATAVASGARVAHLAAPDPRVDGGAVGEVSTDRPVLALGPGWGDADTFRERIRLATTTTQLPGGGQLLFPGRRFVALYGSPISSSLGVLGEQDPEASVRRVQELADQYRPLTPEPIVPAFEIIGTVAAQSAGADGNFTNEGDPADLVPLVDAITRAGGYAVIDLQPGLAGLLDQAKPYAELLKRPNVGLALDAEWKLKPGQQPAVQVGSADAAEFNEVADWLARLTRESGGPQKMLVLHQFSLAMITNRERLDTSHPELATVLHADGHGPPGMKMGTWNTLLAGLDPAIWPAWKNFYTEDQPTFTPEQTMAVTPRPWFVSYQ